MNDLWKVVYLDDAGRKISHVQEIKKDLRAMYGCPCVSEWWKMVSTNYDYKERAKQDLQMAREKLKNLHPYPEESRFAFTARKKNLASQIEMLETQAM